MSQTSNPSLLKVDTTGNDRQWPARWPATLTGKVTGELTGKVTGGDWRWLAVTSNVQEWLAKFWEWLEMIKKCQEGHMSLWTLFFFFNGTVALSAPSIPAWVTVLYATNLFNRAGITMHARGDTDKMIKVSWVKCFFFVLQWVDTLS